MTKHPFGCPFSAMSLRIVPYDTGKPGRTLMVTGAVHGNEYCGPRAIEAVLGHVEKGDITFTGGRIVFVPVCNPAALEKNVRFIDRNLNRELYPRNNPQNNEERLGNELCPLLEETDVLLDIHSYNAQGGPFIFIGPSNEEAYSYAKSLGIRDFVRGWENAYLEASPEEKRRSQGTTEYCRLHGGLALTLECGHHHNENAADIGFNAILHLLRHYNQAQFDPGLFRAVEGLEGPKRLVRMSKVYDRPEGGVFTKDRAHMDEVQKGEVIAVAGEHKFTAPEDGFILLPHADTAVNTEWFYFGVADDDAYF